MKGKILKDPLTLPFPAGLRGKEKEDEKILTSPHPTLSHGGERREGR
jgi:hypothetical protein